MNLTFGSKEFPTISDIDAAAFRLEGNAVETPLLGWAALDELCGGRVLIKPEQLQRTGSFKFRGAFNKLRRLVDSSQGCRAVVAFSSGNHAQGVAAAARILDIRATIVMPADAPTIKIDNTRQHGAEVVLYDRAKDDREAIAARIAADQSATIVPPFDDPDVIAGQGTVGREMGQQAAALGLELDAVLIPCSGGGLIAGSALALRSVWPDLSVYACEPQNFDDTRRSLAAGARVKAPGGPTICDGLMSPTPGRLTFAMNHRLLAGAFAVSDKEVLAAMAYAYRELKLVMEPSGAVALAAVLAGKLDCKGRNVGLVCSGGNVDPSIFMSCLASEAE